MAQRPFNEVVRDIYTEYDKNAGLYDPSTGISVPPLDGPAYRVSVSPLTGQVGTAIRVSLGESGDGGPIYTVKPDELVYNQGRELSPDSGMFVHLADDDVFGRDPAIAERLLSFIQGAHRHARRLKRG